MVRPGWNSRPAAWQPDAQPTEPPVRGCSVFGRLGCENQRQLTPGMLSLLITPEGIEYYELNRSQPGSLPALKKSLGRLGWCWRWIGREYIFGSGIWKMSSKTLKYYLDLNPTSDVLFQRPRDGQNKKFNPTGDKIWFCNAPLGTTTLDSTMKEISLGITLSETLNWKPHVLDVKNKANRTLGCIKRNLHSCPERVKAQAYTSLVRPVLEYGSSAWDPYRMYLKNWLEQVQRRAARYTTKTYSRQEGCVSQALNYVKTKLWFYQLVW